MGLTNQQKFSPQDDRPDGGSAAAELWLNGDTDAELLLDVFQDDDNIYVKSTIAGVDVSDLDISINNEILTIRGKREDREEANYDDYFYKECYWGKFSRSIILPQEIDADKAEATINNGVLTIVLPKLNRQRQKKLRVKTH